MFSIMVFRLIAFSAFMPLLLLPVAPELSELLAVAGVVIAIFVPSA